MSKYIYGIGLVGKFYFLEYLMGRLFVIEDGEVKCEGVFSKYVIID